MGRAGSQARKVQPPHSIALDSPAGCTSPTAITLAGAGLQSDPAVSGRMAGPYGPLAYRDHPRVTISYVCGSSPMRRPKLPVPGLPVGIPPKDQLVMVFSPDGQVKRRLDFSQRPASWRARRVHALAVDRHWQPLPWRHPGQAGPEFPPASSPRAAKARSPRTDDPGVTNRSSGA